MTIRTSKRTVTFTRPFILGEFDEEQPAGSYVVETDEELLEGISFSAYRRILVRIHLNPRPGFWQALTIDSNELDAALKRDRAASELSVDTHSNQKTPNGTGKSLGEEEDRQAIERGEDEGMLVDPR